MLGCVALGFTTQGQQIIHLKNPSFEMNREAKSGEAPVHWVDMGPEFESPPDIQPGSFSVKTPAVHGNYYLGMVVRDNSTFESIGQSLNGKLLKDSLYSFSAALARSDLYISLSRATGQQTNFSDACVLQIIGTNTKNKQSELLAETTPVEHTGWKNYRFQLRPQSGDYDYLQLKVFYVVGSNEAYNGNILIDNLSPIIQETP
jgi:hypothetical protein